MGIGRTWYNTGRSSGPKLGHKGDWRVGHSDVDVTCKERGREGTPLSARLLSNCLARVSLAQLVPIFETNFSYSP
jgi:hypothetical protein